MNHLNIVPMELAYLRSYWETVGAVMAEGRYLSRVENFSFEGSELFVRGLLRAGVPFLVVIDPAVDRVVGWADANRAEEQLGAGMLGMGLLEGYREKGLGRRLLLELLERCRAFGYTAVLLDVRASNQRAIRLYKSLGFELVEVLENDITVFEPSPQGMVATDRREDVLRMSLTL